MSSSFKEKDHDVHDEFYLSFFLSLVNFRPLFDELDIFMLRFLVVCTAMTAVCSAPAAPANIKDVFYVKFETTKVCTLASCRSLSFSTTTVFFLPLVPS